MAYLEQQAQHYQSPFAIVTEYGFAADTYEVHPVTWAELELLLHQLTGQSRVYA